MAGRQSHGNAPSKKPRAKNNSKKRTLDAFSIASHENPDKVKIRQHRLGAQEGGNRPGKRRRNDEEDDDGEEEEEAKPKKQRKEKGRFDELDLDEGSDSEGNEWKLGQVDSDDDSDLDSDEAFGESDEERFEGFAFGGSSEGKKKKKARGGRDVNLDEEDGEDSDSELEEGDLGEGAVDLATMLDMAEEEEAAMRAEAEDNEGVSGKRKGRFDVDSDLDGDDEEKSDGPDFESDLDDEEESEESDDESSESSVDDEDDSADPAKLAALHNLIGSLPQTEGYKSSSSKQRGEYATETNAPSEWGLMSSKKKASADSEIQATTEPLKKLKDKKRPVLEVPLEKRQQDRLDRSAAYEKSKETLDRWTDTVKHNRRADHLMFPLQDNDMTSARANKSLLPTNLSKPFNELEATIQSILEESGLATANGKDDEDHIREFEELETNKLSIEEVKARRDQLRMARELMFREEVKSKRIKKIKSKSYRKVHRKQREKQDRLEKEALLEGGFEPSEDELEKQDRRRAEERMGAKHRESKWAKAMKGTGRAAWDEDARSGITEMARRDEELRKRVEGRSVRKEFEDDSEQSLSESDDEASEDESAQQKRLLEKLEGVSSSNLVDESVPGAKLANMDFMRKADAVRRKQNEAMVEDMRRELAGEESSSEDEAGDIGRRIFGPGSNADLDKKSKVANGNEFEEPAGSDDEEGDELKIHGTDNGAKRVAIPSQKKGFKQNTKPSKQPLSTTLPVSNSEGGAWSKVTSKSSTVSEAEAKRRRHKKNNAIDVEELDLSQAAVIAIKPKSKKPAKKSSTLEVDSDSDETNDDNAIHLPFAIRDQDLIKRAFAGADVVGEFEAEKKQTAEDEDDKVIDNALPGWGSWIGEGVSKREKARNKGRFLTKVEGIKADKRKDAKLERVIINEKRVKKNSKYLATTLPHTYATQQQYERALRLPIGPEWSTKETFQDMTKPRVMVKQGIIAPMSKPLL